MLIRLQTLTACPPKPWRRWAGCMLAALVLVAAPAGAQTLATIERTLLPQQDGMLKGGAVDGTFWESLAFLRTEEDRQRAIRGNVTFGMTGDSSGPRSLFKMNTGIALSRGT